MIQRREARVNPDGSCELFEAVCVVSDARNFLGNKPLIFLMTMFPKYGKSRIEIAFVFPDYDGTYQERERKGAIVPKNRWIDNLTSQAADDADGTAFYNDKEMELYVRCCSGY